MQNIITIGHAVSHLTKSHFDIVISVTFDWDDDDDVYFEMFNAKYYD